jgi:hypothetical protein
MAGTSTPGGGQGARYRQNGASSAQTNPAYCYSNNPKDPKAPASAEDIKEVAEIDVTQQQRIVDLMWQGKITSGEYEKLASRQSYIEQRQSEMGADGFTNAELQELKQLKSGLDSLISKAETGDISTGNRPTLSEEDALMAAEDALTVQQQNMAELKRAGIDLSKVSTLVSEQSKEEAAQIMSAFETIYICGSGNPNFGTPGAGNDPNAPIYYPLPPAHTIPVTATDVGRPPVDPRTYME